MKNRRARFLAAIVAESPERGTSEDLQRKARGGEGGIEPVFAYYHFVFGEKPLVVVVAVTVAVTVA